MTLRATELHTGPGSERRLRVMLMYPPVTLHFEDMSIPVRPTLLGLLYLASAVRNAGHEVSLVDCFCVSPCPEHSDALSTRYGISDSLIREKLRMFQPDVVGVSSMYTQCFKDAHLVARLAGEECPDALVVFGGTHATTLPDIALKDTNVDLIVIGEGEITFVEILKRIVAGGSFAGVEGVAYRSEAGVVHEAPRQPIDNLDRLPSPAWDLIEHDIAGINADHATNRYLMRRPVGFIQTSRGCPHDCYFCSFVIAFGRKWRSRSAKNVVDEMEMLVRKYGYRELHIIDDNCSVSKQRMIEMCDEIIRRKLEVRIATPSGIAINTLDKQLLTKMKEAGFYRLCFGIEAGDPNSQKLVDKRVDLGRARDTIALANRLGFWTSGTFIIGHPHEGESEVRASIEFAKSTHLDFAVFAILIPQFGTKVYDLMKAQGLVDSDPTWADPGFADWHKIALLYGNGARTASFTNQDLQHIRAMAYREFLLHKISSPRTYSNLIRKIKNVEDFTYLMRMIIVPCKMLINNFLNRFTTYLPLRQK